MGAVESGGKQFVFAELGHYGYSGGEDEPQPLPFSVNGVSGVGRGVLIDEGHLVEFTERYRSNIFVSHFRFADSNFAAVEELGSKHQLPLLGDYYVVFNASSSAEIVHAINQAIDLVERLKTNCDVPYDAVYVYYTNRNIEVNVDYTVFGIEPTPRLDEVFLHMTCALVGIDPQRRERTSAFSQLDLDAYSYDYMSHVPGTAIASGKQEIFKVRMSYGAFKKMSYTRLQEFAKNRPDLPHRERWPEVVPKAAEFYRSIKNSIEREKRGEDRDVIQRLFYGTQETQAEISTLAKLAPLLLRRLFDETRSIIPTHSPHLNKALGGGFQPGQFYVLAGAPGTGTSTLALQLLNHAAGEHNAVCLYISLQRGVEEVFKRSLSQLGGITASEIDRKRRNIGALYEDSEFNNRIMTVFNRYKQFADNITIIEGAAAADFVWLRQYIRDIKARMADVSRHDGIILVVDTLQLLAAMMRTTAQDYLGELHTERRMVMNVVDLTARLKSLCREEDIAVLATLEHIQPHRGLSSEYVQDDPSLRSLMDCSQFADTLVQLLRQNGSLLNLRDYYSTRFRGTPQEAQLPAILDAIDKAELEYNSRQDVNRLRSEFIVADIIKNRSGGTEKVLFVYNRPVSNFEPMDYLPPMPAA
jgi:replicative DNA helicase